MSSASCKNIDHVFDIYELKEFGINNLRWVICHKMKPNPSRSDLDELIDRYELGNIYLSSRLSLYIFLVHRRLFISIYLSIYLSVLL